MYSVLCEYKSMEGCYLITLYCTDYSMYCLLCAYLTGGAPTGPCRPYQMLQPSGGIYIQEGEIGALQSFNYLFVYIHTKYSPFLIESFRVSALSLLYTLDSITQRYAPQC